MSFFGKPPAGQPNRSFNLSQQNGEQVDAVRSKIASLLDGAAAKQPENEQLSEPSTLDSTVSANDQDGMQPDTVNSTDFRSEQANRTASQTVTNQQENEWPSPAEWPRRTKWQVEPDNERRDHDRHEVPPQNAQRSWGVHSTEEKPKQSQFSGKAHSIDTFGGQNSGDAQSTHVNSRPFFDTVTGNATGNAAGNAEINNQPAPAQPKAEDSAAPVGTNAINIKGRAGGILIELGNGHWPALMAALGERLAGAGNFFRNGSVALDLAGRSLAEQELHQLHQMLSDQTLELVLVRTASQETFQVALDMGLSAQLETMEGETTASAQPAGSNLGNEPHFVYAGHLRAGQVLQRSEHILVIGDVNPGATVISNGDILVWGHLRGFAHAGAGGDIRAVIAALNLAAVQLRISDFVAIAPEQPVKRRWGRQQTPPKQAEVAYINGDRIIVEPWETTKFGGIATLRH